jgi:hypothetical protein
LLRPKQKKDSVGKHRVLFTLELSPAEVELDDYDAVVIFGSIN